MEALTQEHSMRAQIDVSLPRIDFAYEPPQFRINKRLASADRDNWRAALFHGMKTLFNCELFPNRFSVFTNSTASCAGQIAGVQGLEHHDERKLFNTANAFTRDVCRHAG